MPRKPQKGTTEIGRIFVQEIVLPFGFLNGLWVYLGVNPKTEVLKALSSIIQELASNSELSTILWLIPTLTTILYVVVSYLVGGWLGLVAVGLAFLSGAIILIQIPIGTFLFIFAFVLGLFAPMLKSKSLSTVY